MTTKATISLPQTYTKDEKLQQPGMKMRFIIGFIALTFSTILILRSRRALVPDVIDHEFGVAFDLTSPYG